MTPRKGPWPPAELRRLLAEHRSRGVSFDAAWHHALPAATPLAVSDNREWRPVLDETREAWRSAYEGTRATSELVGDLREPVA